MWGLPALGCTLVGSALLLRRLPLAALAVVLGGSAASAAVEPAPARATLVVAAVVVVCGAGLEICYMAATRTRGVSVVGVAMAVGFGVLIPFLNVPLPGAQSGDIGGSAVHLATIALSLAAILAWLIGNSIRLAHARAEALTAQSATQTALAERLRIARELHDIVAHSIGIIAIQAGAAHRVFDTSPAEARDALAAIEATSRETLSGLRRMVTGLRNEEPGSGRAALGPAPGLADLGRLAAQTLDAGVRVEVDWRGSREPLPADIDLSAFRIVQEAVANVVRHAGAGECLVVIDRRDGQLSIEITDGGRGGDVASPACASAPRCSAASSPPARGPGGGFRVAVRLPVPAPAPTQA
ncbi:sensor histidine kinase [Trebonia kvetii]|nr:histidine kinase [Trebonia kvetii]